MSEEEKPDIFSYLRKKYEKRYDRILSDEEIEALWMSQYEDSHVDHHCGTTREWS